MNFKEIIKDIYISTLKTAPLRHYYGNFALKYYTVESYIVGKLYDTDACKWWFNHRFNYEPNEIKIDNSITEHLNNLTSRLNIKALKNKHKIIQYYMLYEGTSEEHKELVEKLKELDLNEEEKYDLLFTIMEHRHTFDVFNLVEEIGIEKSPFSVWDAPEFSDEENQIIEDFISKNQDKIQKQLKEKLYKRLTGVLEEAGVKNYIIQDTIELPYTSIEHELYAQSEWVGNGLGYDSNTRYKKTTKMCQEGVFAELDNITVGCNYSNYFVKSGGIENGGQVDSYDTKGVELTNQFLVVSKQLLTDIIKKKGKPLVTTEFRIGFRETNPEKGSYYREFWTNAVDKLKYRMYDIKNRTERDISANLLKVDIEKHGYTFYFKFYSIGKLDRKEIDEYIKNHTIFKEVLLPKIGYDFDNIFRIKKYD